MFLKIKFANLRRKVPKNDEEKTNWILKLLHFQRKK
jgi:hypothetical protein